MGERAPVSPGLESEGAGGARARRWSRQAVASRTRACRVGRDVPEGSASRLKIRRPLPSAPGPRRASGAPGGGAGP